MRLLVLLALLLALPCVLVAQDDQPSDPQPPTEEVEEPPTDEEPSVAEEKPKSSLRPMTEAEEEQHKLQAVREDPFLNAEPGPDPKNLAFYRPLDWLRTAVPYDTARYLIQDAAGTFQGFLTIELRPDVSTADELIRLSLDSAAPKRRVEMLMTVDSLKPRAATILAPAVAPEEKPLDKKAAKLKAKAEKRAKSKTPPVETVVQPEQAAQDQPAERITRVEYVFDRVTIQRDAGLVTTQERMRQLPYSFDIEQLPLLVRQLDFERLEKQWPFEALLIDPARKRTLSLQIQKPKQVEVLTAEPQTRRAFELAVSLGEGEAWTWWVERTAPHRLLKFTDGRYTYTLNHYETAPGAY